MMTKLNKQDVTERLGFSMRKLDLMVVRGEFPPPVKVGKTCIWSEAAVAKFEARMFAEQMLWEPPVVSAVPAMRR